MVTMNIVLEAWGTERFPSVLKSELEKLRSDVLPISHAAEKGNRLDDSDLGIIVNEVTDDDKRIHAKVGVFCAQYIDCVTCGGGRGIRDEAYCELLVCIDKSSGATEFKPI